MELEKVMIWPIQFFKFRFWPRTAHHHSKTQQAAPERKADAHQK